MSRTVQDLLRHMYDHKDATVIVGPAAAKYITPASDEDMDKLYTHKSLRRTPEKFWEFYKEFIYIDPNHKPTLAYTNIGKLCKLGYIGAVISQNTDPILKKCVPNNLIQIHGSTDTVSCIKCKKQQAINKFCICEDCNGPVRPDVLLFGENYKQENFDAMGHHILNTHTLILIGVDFNEEPIANLIEKFCDLKEAANESPNKKDHRLAVIIGELPFGYDPIVQKDFEFIVKDEPDEATKRLIAYEEAFKLILSKEEK